MAFVTTDELQSAAQELAQFSAMMTAGKPPQDAMSTRPPSRSDLESEEPLQPAMELDSDREKRERAAAAAGETAPKFAKGETKGQDNRSSAPSGKGQAAPSEKQVIEETTAASLPDAAPAPGNQREARETHNRTERKNWWGGGGGGGNRRQDSWDSHWPARRDSDRRDNRREDRRSDREAQEARLRELLLAVARLLLRLEDAQSVMLLDTEFIFFLQTKASGNQWAIVDSLHQVALRWHSMKAQDPASLQQPMRIVLLTCLLEALLNQMQLLESNPDAMQKAVDMGLVEGSSYVYLQWDSSQRKHIKAAQEPLPHQTAVQIVRQLQHLLICPDTVGRFHALRKLAPNMSSDVVPFSLAVQNRNQEAMQMYGLFRRLARNSCLHLIACTMRPAKLQRSPLAQQISRMLQNM